MKEALKNIGSLLISGTSSGSGKTTLTIALLAALKKRGIPLSSFKCGPDYIDPMFHREVLGVPSYNLDPFFLSSEQLRAHLAAHSSGLSLIEGVMGYYDGVGPKGRFSTYDVAKVLHAPVILALDARGMSNSAAALIHGFQSYKPDSGIKAVIFNKLSSGMYPMMKRIAEEAGVVSLGYLPMTADASIESRHLGLVTDMDKDEILRKIALLGSIAEECIDIDALLSLSRKNQDKPYFAFFDTKRTAQTSRTVAHDTTEPIDPAPASANKHTPAQRPTIAVARDSAFCFIYEENLDALKNLGAELVFFSPLKDTRLPKADGIYIPGGYPEAHLQALTENKSMLRSIKDAIASGMPTIAECGGFMYLHRSIDGAEMVGEINGEAFRTKKLQRFGYTYISPNNDGLLGKAGSKIRCHEFHYYDSTAYGTDCSAVKARGGEIYPCAHHAANLYAGFPHLYFPAHPEIARRFVAAAADYSSMPHHY